MFNSKKMFNITVNSVRAIHKNKILFPLLIITAFCLATLAVLYAGSAPFLSRLKQGDVSLRTVYAPYDFSYPTGVDVKETDIARKEAEEKIPPVYDIDPSRQEEAFGKIDKFFNSVKAAQQNTGLTDKERIELVRSDTGSALSDKDIGNFVDATDLDRIRKISKDALENIYLVGIIAAEDKTELARSKIKNISIRNTRFKVERPANIKGLVDEKEAGKVVLDMLERLIPQDRQIRATLYNLIKEEITVNTALTAEETDARKSRARGEIPDIYRKEEVKKSELIVEKGKRITKEDIAKLTQITLIHSLVNRTSYLSGLFILLVGLTIVAAAYLMLFAKKLIRIPKHVLLISINAFLAILISLVIIQSELPAYVIPMASVGMILALLLGAGAAFITSLVLSIYVGFMAGGELDLAFVLFIGSAVGIYAVRGARRRSQIFFAGFLVSIASFISIAGIGLFNNMGRETVCRLGLWGVTNGIVSSFVVIGLLPVFEYAFSLVTNITLLELSDLSSPLLKDLTIKAPGTYHHSILVGNLAEEACNAIGANALLARVGAYYHDIGKKEKAEYFAENEMGIKSKHEKLTPSMSALIITNHTKDGIDLAKKHKLNSAITDFIGQHHGTSLIYYFYQRALEKVKSENELKEEEFRYPGPKPQTKETAIVLLADSVEASSRMLSDPTPARIRSLVQKITNNKFIDGQLDECELTLTDLHKISESFVRVLMGVFHSRLEYPEVKTKKERQNALKNKSKQSKP